MIIYILLGICIVLSIVSIVVAKQNKSSVSLSSLDKKDITDSFSNNINAITNALSQGQQVNNQTLMASIKVFQENLTANQTALEKRVQELIKQLDDRMQSMSKNQEDKLEAIRQSNDRHLKSLQEDNNKQLDKMRETVDEKLSKTINERFDQSFKVLNDQLEKVYKSIGEMQTMAADVGSLSKALSSVKTTGIFGEVQLGAILEQLLTKDQYATNIVLADGRDPVEYAIKLPGKADGEWVYMPLDSKFPYTVYTDMQDAYEKGDLDEFAKKKAQLKTTIQNMAKDIKNKYIYPPKTTDFAVMFLPIEGLYAEVVKMGLMSELQSKYKITIAGPTTMSALLNSLQMGFKTLAIQKKSGEVWNILSAVRTEFDKFNDIIRKIQNKIDDAGKEFDTLVGTRSRMLASKLKSVDMLTIPEAETILGIEAIKPTDNQE